MISIAVIHFRQNTIRFNIIADSLYTYWILKPGFKKGFASIYCQKQTIKQNKIIKRRTEKIIKGIIKEVF